MSADQHGAGGATSCDFCDEKTDELVSATIIDDSGGAGICLCPSCRRRVDSRRCGLCGEPVSPNRKADGVIFHDELERKSGTAICDGCRERAVFGAGDAREAR